VDIKSEPLICYYSDINRSNFPVDRQGQLWVVDFQESGVLPASLMSFALRARHKHSIPVSLLKSVPLPRCDHLRAMGFATYVLNFFVDTFCGSLAPFPLATC
jgi:hypothetical protein